MKEVTLVFLIDSHKGQILLPMKKIGFGAGKYNGVGGKVENGESVVEGAVREVFEEIAVTVNPDDLQMVAKLRFSFEPDKEPVFHCHVFICNVWAGVPSESEEMAPHWFAVEDIPYKEMWIDDSYWLPMVLSGKKLDAEFHLSPDGNQVLSHKISDSVM